jgi:hypothetical protein
LAEVLEKGPGLAEVRRGEDGEVLGTEDVEENGP